MLLTAFYWLSIIKALQLLLRNQRTNGGQLRKPTHRIRPLWQKSCAWSFWPPGGAPLAKPDANDGSILLGVRGLSLSNPHSIRQEVARNKPK